jgi:hypothetical protein
MDVEVDVAGQFAGQSLRSDSRISTQVIDDMEVRFFHFKYMIKAILKLLFEKLANNVNVRVRR